MTELCPVQQKALSSLERIFKIGNIGVLYCDAGMGRTTVLQNLQRRVGGVLVPIQDYLEVLNHQHPIALEETFGQLLLQTLQENDCVIFDDLHLLTSLTTCHHFYNRHGLLQAPLTAAASYAIATGKKLFFGTEGSAPASIHQRCYYCGIDEYTPEDYEFLCRAHLKAELATSLDYRQVHRFAPKLNAHQLKSACLWLHDETDLDTERFIEYLRSQRMTSNVSLREVRDVHLRDLKGMDDLIASLEANIVLPLENDELATELNLKPKRGVLLAGPPGTGKTTIGRALAHRLKSKFFLIDGTFISGTRDFYPQVREVFELAKQNAPSIIFIDDSDAIFQNGEELGLYRYLLTMLDGLESESSGQVCVMMTAMDVGHLPPALIRSGRIELWLETQLPDAAARLSILQARFKNLPASVSTVRLDEVVEATEGFTGADLYRLVEDGKTLFAYDKAQNRPLQETTSYFLSAVETVRANKERYAEAEMRASQQQSTRSPFGDLFAGMMAAGMDSR